MKDYHKHNQEKVTPEQIRELKIKTFPYLSNDDSLHLNMSDRNWILTPIQSCLTMTSSPLGIFNIQ